MSSTMASVSMNTLAAAGRRRPRIAMTPSANAMSVAIGIPQPWISGVPGLSTAYSRAGTAMPPNAATIATAARRGSRNSPPTISYLISRPTTKKKTAMRASLTQCRRSSARTNRPTSMVTSVVQNCSYASDHGEFASTSATSAATSRTIPPADSTRRKAATGRPTYLASGRSLANQNGPVCQMPSSVACCSLLIGLSGSGEWWDACTALR
jgi:hypothetical protein